MAYLSWIAFNLDPIEGEPDQMRNASSQGTAQTRTAVFGDQTGDQVSPG